MPLHSDRRMTLRWAKSGPPLRGRNRKPAGFVAAFAQATSLRFAPLLSSGFSVAMTTLLLN
jgi:hypothetical protein